MNGILPLWKPKGMTSHDCVMKIRKIFGTRKVGHTGTLDPEVEGVLVICIGQATKVVPYLTAMDKSYIAECSLGEATETEDAHGDVVERKLVIHPPSRQDIEHVLHSFRGEITQIPPMYSAVKVNGKRLYEYARENKYVERPSRQVMIYKLTQLQNQMDNTGKFKIKAVCSAGTYMRTLCVDIGKKLGYPAHMSDLVRVEACSFKAEETVTFADLEEAKQLDNLNDLLVPIAKSLEFLDSMHVNEEVAVKVLNGQKLTKPDKGLTTEPFLITFNQQLLAIYETHPEHPEQIKPVRVFNELANRKG
jgi:tRNA pseudouridine55 synthase